MKKLSFIALFVILSAFGVARAEKGQVQTYGAIRVGSMTTITVTTTPVLALSTGTNFPYENYSRNISNINISSSATVAAGQVLDNRVHMEFSNDTSTDVYVGYDASVSTQNNVFRGRRIAPGGSWSHDCSIIEHWVVSSTTTENKFTITQEK